MALQITYFSVPRSRSARLLLESDPHSVIEGLLIGAYAVNAAQCIICVNAEYDLAIKRLGKAIEQLKEYNLLGNNILDSSFNCQLEIMELEDHPWFLGCQFHPEFKSHCMDPHPLFRDFIRASLGSQGVEGSGKRKRGRTRLRQGG